MVFTGLLKKINLKLFAVLFFCGVIFISFFSFSGKAGATNFINYILNGNSRIQEPDVIKGIYLTAETMSGKSWPDYADTLVKSGGNTIVMDIQYGGGLLAFEPRTSFVKQINPGRKAMDIPKLISELHKKGIYVIARQAIFNDPYLSSKKPEWRIKYKSGGDFDPRWVDPSKPGVQIYNLYIMREVAEMGFDEIQFDYIRFPATAHGRLDYFYDEEKFSRADVINNFLSKAKRVADFYDVKFSVDVFGAIIWGDVDWKIVGQDPSTIVDYVDTICPMTYPSHVSPGYYGFKNPWGDPYSFVEGSIEKFVEKAAGKAKIRTWVQGFPLHTPNFGSWYMDAQVKATYDAGGNGFTIWSPGNHYGYSWTSFALGPDKSSENGTGN